MKMTNHSTKFKADELEQINRFVSAFENNFHEIIVHRYPHGSIEVYLNEKDVNEASYVQYCDNLDYFMGWLNGAVQANNQRIV